MDQKETWTKDKQDHDHDDLDWYIVEGLAGRKIGALGFLGDEVVVITSFYDDRDGNRDGSVSIPERVVYFLSPLKTKGSAVVDVAMAARDDVEVSGRDPEFYQLANTLFLRFARGLVTDGAYTAWMGVSISMAAGAVSRELATGIVKQFVIKKGMEAPVKMALKKAMGRPDV
jgi:hypothetical protein